MKTVLFVIGNLDLGGAERHLVQVLPKLADLNFCPIVYALTHKGKLAQEMVDKGVKVVQPPFADYLKKLPPLLKKSLLLPLTAITLCMLFIRLRPAVVHFFLPESYLLGGLCSLLTGKRIRIMSRRSLNRYQTRYPVLAKVERWLHPRMSAVLGNSNAVVLELKNEGVQMDRLGLLYNGIDPAPFDDLPSRGSVRRGLGISEQALLMVCVANLIPYKGHADLIQALGEIHQELPNDWVIAMVGRDNGMGVELSLLAEKHGIAEHILWLGERADAIAIYAAAEIGVLASHEEGFSNSVLEGMAAGAAMVVTDVGGNGEAVIDGVCGIVVPARNPSVLGKALLTLIYDTDMRLRMAKAGHQRVVEEFTLDACVSRYAGLYRALLRDSNCAVQKALDSARGGVS